MAVSEDYSTALTLRLLVFVDRRAGARELIQRIRQQLEHLSGDYPTQIELVEVGERPYLVEHYKLVATPALVKTHPTPAQVLAGKDLASQLEVWWPRWQGQLQLLDEDRDAEERGEVLEQTAELLQLSEEVFKLRQQQVELKEQLLFKDRILAMLAHDLRNPLSAASMAIETLEQNQGKLTPELSEQLFGHARTQTRVMESMIADLLEAARGTSSELSLSTAELPFADLCREAIEEVAQRAAAKKLTLKTDIPDVLPTVHADRDKIRQVLMNLLDNAIKYTPENGTICLAALHRTSQKVEVSVTDTGPGIPAEARERVFSDMVRLARDRNSEGYGIGLFLCRRIIRSHYGRIWVNSEPGEGSSFHFTLPVYRVQ
ncbi:histidine kinase [Synechococcus sp. PCC 7336]|uniref:histidine kinase n=1 Tax=Synechococcus sp. PCC 7336 TaxID=195250 RepID=UPI00034CC047|nr:histidine kinase [Synechococcus sp. PCC 7336]